ncbi:Fc.00g079610.m01.CDS01 [Cosmosporella sp. VM-42]
MLRLLPLTLAWLVALSGADITVSVSDVESFPLDTAGSVTSSAELFLRSCPEEFSNENPYKPEILLSSQAGFGSADVISNGTIFPSSDSFIRGALEAWAKHQHLILRPDEIWFEILAQLNFYMSVHAEDLRDLFVSHKERETIQVRAFSWRDVVAAFGTEIQERVKTDWLQEWIMPGFSTSTEDDSLAATVLMMGLMQHYFEFEGMVICGLPKVTLLGEREDWVRLLGKLDRLKEWGKQPQEYAQNLRPILSRFVKTWDEPESLEIKSFWNQIVRADRYRGWNCGGGGNEYEYHISGWITGFLHWRKDGNLRVVPKQDFDYYDDNDDDEQSKENDEIFECPSCVTLDNTTYIPEDLDSIPVGYAKAPLKMIDYPAPGVKTEAYLLAGNIGVKRERVEGEVTARPLSGWVLYAPVDWGFERGPWVGDSGEVERIAEGMGEELYHPDPGKGCRYSNLELDWERLEEHEAEIGEFWDHKLGTTTAVLVIIDGDDFKEWLCEGYAVDGDG